MATPAVGAIEQGYRFRGGDPGDQANWEPLTGEDYLRGMDPARAALIRSIANGDASIGNRANASNLPLLQDVARYDPSFTQSDYQTRLSTRRSFTSGADASNKASANTTLAHMAAMSDAIEHLGNYGPDARDQSFASNPLNPLNWFSQANNQAAHAVADATGTNARFNTFNMTKQAVASEMTRLFRGSGGAEADVQGWLKNLDDSQSEDALRASVRTGMDLVRGRLQALADKYQQGMGRTVDPLTFLTPENQNAFRQLASAGYVTKPQHDPNAFTVTAPVAHPQPPSQSAPSPAPNSREAMNAALIARSAPPGKQARGYSADGYPVFSPQDYAAARANPANKGLKFYDQDGNLRAIP